MTSLIPEEITECSLVATGPPGVCLSEQSLSVAAELVNADVSDVPADEIIEKVKEKLSCNSQRCIVMSSDFKKRAGSSVAEKEIAVNFKPEGPTDVSLLSNYNIDLTLQQWAVSKFSGPDDKFFAYNFNMRDFAKQGDTLATIPMDKLINSGYKTFACVINTDYYNGRGKHWMALFGDMRGDPWTVEFFNSSGNEPLPEYAKWLVDTKEMMDLKHRTEIIKCTGIEHQKSKTECGVYSLYYIWARLHGTPASYFLTHEINDVLCFEMRQHLFYDPRRAHIPLRKFSYPAWSSTTRVEWEPEVKPKDIPVITGQREITIGGAEEVETAENAKHDLFDEWLSNGFSLNTDRPVAVSSISPPVIAVLPQRAQLLSCCLAISLSPTKYVMAHNIDSEVITDLKNLYPDKVFVSEPSTADFTMIVNGLEIPDCKPFAVAIIHGPEVTIAGAEEYYVPWAAHELCLSVCKTAQYRIVEGRDPSVYKSWVHAIPFKATRHFDLIKGYDGCMDCAAEIKILESIGIDMKKSNIYNRSLYVWPHGIAGDLENEERFQLVVKLYNGLG